MKRFLLSLVALAFFSLPSADPAFAACGGGSSNCFVVAGGGNSNATSTWSATSGGGTCTCTPAATDTVILDSAAGNLTINAAFSVASLNATGTGGSGSPYTGTLTLNSGTTATFTGDVTLVSGMTFSRGSGTSVFQWTNTSGTAHLTTAGKTMPNITINGVGGTLQYLDAVSLGTNVTTTLTAGTLDQNGKTVTSGFAMANSVNAIFTMGAGTWIVNNSGGFSIAGSSANVTASSGTINFSDFIGATTAALANKSYGTVTISPNTGTNASAVSVTCGGGCTIGTFNITGPRQISFNQTHTFTITNAFNWTGPLTFRSSSTGTQYTIAAGAASTIGTNANPVMVQDMNTTTSAVNVIGYSLLNNTFSSGGITAPAAGGGIIGG